MIRAATSLRQRDPSGTIAANPGSASAAVIAANDPGGPTAGIVTGARPARAPSWSAIARPVARRALAGGTSRSVGMPSANGTCATIAAMSGSLAPSASTWPPLNDEPQSAMRRGSTPARVRAKATAAR